MNIYLYFTILFYFFKSSKSANISCEGCSTLMLNSNNLIYFYLDFEPQLIKVLYEGTFNLPIKYIYLNITKIDKEENIFKYECKDNFNNLNFTLNKKYLIVVGYENKDYETNIYLIFHNVIPSKIYPEQIIKSTDYYLYIYSKNKYSYNTNINVNLTLKTQGYSYNINDCKLNNLTYLYYNTHINEPGRYFLYVDDKKYDEIYLDVVDKNFALTNITPSYMININENNFYLTLTVESKLYSSLAHEFEFKIADNSTDYRNIVLSNCKENDTYTLYCNKTSSNFKELSVYYFYYNGIKLDDVNIFTGEEKKKIEFINISYDNYINDGQSNLKSIIIEVSNTNLNFSELYLIDENNSKINLRDCYKSQLNKIECISEIYYVGNYNVYYINYSTSLTINFVSNNIYLTEIIPNTIKLNENYQQSVYLDIILYFNNNFSISNSNGNFINNISICNSKSPNCRQFNSCSNISNIIFYCKLTLNSYNSGYNYIYINKISTKKYINLIFNTTSYLLKQINPSKVKYGNIFFELEFYENASKFKYLIKIGHYDASCDDYNSNSINYLECQVYIGIVGNYSVYVNNTYTGKILDVKNEIIQNYYDDDDDDSYSSSNINFIKFKNLYLFYIVIFFIFNFY